MSRVKTFDSTGTAPNGRIYAGDLNSIQDHYADLSDYSQTVDLSTLRVGSSDIQILKYGTGELRVTSAVRLDGGFLPGRYTTTQRNALTNPATGVIIFNTTTNQIEINLGSPSVPLWSPITDPPGTILDYGGASLPSGFLWCDGASYSRTTYAALFTALGTVWNTFGGLADPGGASFRVPDLRALTTAGKADMGGSTPARAIKLGRAAASTLAGLFGEEYHVLVVGEMPIHNHGVSDPGHAHSVYDPGHGHGCEIENQAHEHYGVTQVNNVDHSHGFGGIWALSLDNTGTFAQTFPQGNQPYWVTEYRFASTVGQNTNHVHEVWTGSENRYHTHYIDWSGTNVSIYSAGTGISTQNAGSSATHENTPPVAIVNKIIKY